MLGRSDLRVPQQISLKAEWPSAAALIYLSEGFAVLADDHDRLCQRVTGSRKVAKAQRPREFEIVDEHPERELLRVQDLISQTGFFAECGAAFEVDRTGAARRRLGRLYAYASSPNAIANGCSSTYGNGTDSESCQAICR